MNFIFKAISASLPSYVKLEFMSLFETRQAYKPFEYPWAYEAYKDQQRMHWLPDEVPMADDVRDWKFNLTTGEKNLCTQVFRFFTQADIEVNDCYMTKYASIFKPTEIKMMLSSFASMEAVHIDAYSHLVDTIGMPDSLYQEFLNYREMKAKYDYLHKFETSDIRGTAITLAAFGAFTEGLQLFASFAILLNFSRFGKMKGMGQIVTWSVRDESLHANSIIKLFKTLLSEHPELSTNDLVEEITNVCATIVYFEDAFVDLAFEIDGGVEGLKAKDVKKYIRYIANRRLIQLGFDPIYLIDENPLPWMDYILNGIEHANFFEQRATEYSKAATVGTWNDAFDVHDNGSDLLFNE